MRESALQSEIMLALSQAGHTVWRQNTGLAWVGTPHPMKSGDVLLTTPRRLHVGLMRGSSDIIGICNDGRFLAVEVKTKEGRVTDEQRTFIDIVRRKGGRAGVARSVDEAIEIARGNYGNTHPMP